jgi:hypothetical protein
MTQLYFAKIKHVKLKYMMFSIYIISLYYINCESIVLFDLDIINEPGGSYMAVNLKGRSC